MGGEGFPLLPIDSIRNYGDGCAMGKENGKQRYERVRFDSAQHGRLRLIMAVFCLGTLLLIAWRLYDLMIAQYDYYAKLALRNQTRTTFVSARRGEIYDRNMNILATSQGVENVYLDPHELKQSKADIQQISQVLGEILDEDP